MSSSNQAAATQGPRRSARLQRLRRSAARLSDIHNGNAVSPASPVRQIAIPPVSSTAPSSAVNISSSDTGEDIADDDLCPICQLLLYRPVRTQCNHLLCEFCMAHWADVSVTSQMTIVDVDEEPVDFNPVSDLQAKCPMCRTATSASLDLVLAQSLADKYPRQMAERKAEEEADRQTQQSGGEGVQTITVYVGNKHKLVETEDGDGNKHEWTFFVKPSRTDIIEEVQILLHPTFRPSRIVRTRRPYSIRRWGWGFFTITAYVILKAGYTWMSEDAEDSPDGARKGMLPLEWTLDFDGFGGKGSMGRCRLKVKNDRDWAEGGREAARDDADVQRMVRQYQSDGLYQPPVDE